MYVARQLKLLGGHMLDKMLTVQPSALWWWLRWVWVSGTLASAPPTQPQVTSLASLQSCSLSNCQ